MDKIDAITLKMIAFDAGSAERIQHFIKVHRFAQLIGRGEHLDPHTQFVLECTALVHDIGIGPSTEKYGYCNGELQEKEGPAYARQLLCAFDLPEEDIERVCYLVGHHHTYDNIDGIDYQILVEADFLVNLHERQTPKEGVVTTLDRIFKTRTGIQLCEALFGVHQSSKTASH